MDRQSTIGFILIAVVFIAWMIYSSKQSTEMEKSQSELKKSDTVQVPTEKPAQQPPPARVEQESQSSDTISQLRYGKWFTERSNGVEELDTVETDKYLAVFSTRGGSVKRWILKEFFTWNKKPLQLVDWNIPGDVNLLFVSSDGKLIETKDLYHVTRNKPAGGKWKVRDSSAVVLEFYLPVRGDSCGIRKIYTLRNGGYSADLEIEMVGMQDIISNYEYQVIISSPAITEENSVDEAGFQTADAFINNEHIKISASDGSERVRDNRNGKSHWISIKNKYFVNTLIARGNFLGSGVNLEGQEYPLPNQGIRKVYEASMKVSYRGLDRESSQFVFYLGPLKYSILKEQHEGLEQIIDLGWAWIVRPISEYVIIPLFTFLHSFIPNYGLVIIIFTIIIKIALYPLTKSSMDSMRKMQALQPMMAEVREKYKEDPQKQNVEMMRLYKDYGINPAGGCLPLILQMPILFALFTIFRSIIELRQEPFILWIKDLASPDILVHLPFRIPLFGIDMLSGLALAMGITMFIQQKQTVTDPRQKSMVYIMPVMFWLMFNGFPSGLNLYYFMFNLLSIAQQYYVTRKHKDFKLQKVEKKKGSGRGWMERTMSSLQEKAKEQQKTRKR